MTFPQTILLIISGWSVLNGLLLGIYCLFSNWVKKTEANRMLGLIFVAISIKALYIMVCSSVGESSMLCSGLYRMAIFSYCCIGPLLYLYAKGLMVSFFQFKSSYILSFLPPFTGLFLPDSYLTHPIRFYSVQFWLLSFLILTIILIVRQKSKATNTIFLKEKVRWLTIILACITIIWITALTRSHIELVAFFSFLVLAMVYIVIDKKEIIRFESTEQQINLSSKEAISPEQISILKQVEDLMINQKAYLNAEMNLPYLASQLSIPLHTLSKSINGQLGKNFSEYINGYRIDEAGKRLTDNQYDHLSIAGIAFECGFNSLSTFNTTFKRMKGITPSSFRKNG